MQGRPRPGPGQGARDTAHASGAIPGRGDPPPRLHRLKPVLEPRSGPLAPPREGTPGGLAGLSSFVGREVARLTGLEPATPGVTGRYSNRLSYNRA